MKLVSFYNNEHQIRLGLYIDGKIADMKKFANSMKIDLPNNMNEFLEGGEKYLENAKILYDKLKLDNFVEETSISITAPVPRPAACRDAYAFKQHVESARRNRGVDMIEEFYQFPIFYFTNHNAIFGEGEIHIEKDHLIKLDFELEWAAIIGKKGRNIKAEEADSYIAGYTIMNDLSARQMQMEEMKLNLGPAKGKDFATTIGPWLVTPDELEDKSIDSDRGFLYDLKMEAFHNGNKVSEGNTKDMTFTFAEIIERMSYGIDIHPGEVIGSGTVGTGCYLELNGTNKRIAEEEGKEFTPVWLEDGDEIELKVERLGSLKNTIKLTDNDYSILAKKKI